MTIPLTTPNEDATPRPLDVRVAIIGTGFAGIGLAAQLKRSGENSFVLLERASGIGGTWRDNVYPGAACDIQSHLYSYSFRPNPDWSRVYASQPEILAYLQDTVDGEGVAPHVRFDSEVLNASWNDSAERWDITTASGRVRAKILVSAAGHLSDPRLPEIDGLDGFGGPLFHSARWTPGTDLTGLRVGVIGSGASAVQIVPAIAGTAAHVTVFQRSAPYVIPRYDRLYSSAERAMFARLPETAQDLRDDLFWGNEGRFPQRRNVESFVSRIRELATEHLHDQVPHAELRRRLTPDYVIGCKRVLISNEWYPTLLRDDVTLESRRIGKFEPSGAVLSDGEAIPLDVVVSATGFEATKLPIAERIHGRTGAPLSRRWVDGEQAYACTAVPEYPNLFLMNGPNAGLGAGSIIYVVESQIQYILGALRWMREHDVAVVEADSAAETAFVADIDRRSEGTVWLSGGCDSWYLDANRRLTTLWPDFMTRFRRENGRFDPSGYVVSSRQLA